MTLGFGGSSGVAADDAGLSRRSGCDAFCGMVEPSLPPRNLGQSADDSPRRKVLVLSSAGHEELPFTDPPMTIQGSTEQLGQLVPTRSRRRTDLTPAGLRAL